MKLAITSDLHLPKTPADTISRLVSEITKETPDAVILAGDMGESSRDTATCLSLFRPIQCPVLVIAGNHDLFPDTHKSKRLWEEILPRTVRDFGYHWLERNPFIKDGIVIIGTIAWYEYSAAAPNIHESPKTFAAEKRCFTLDHKINWPWSDPEFAELVAQPFLNDLDRLEVDPTIRQIIVVTQVPIIKEQIPRKPSDKTWGFTNGYYGNITLGHEVLARKKITHIISGHTHISISVQARTNAGRIIEAHVIGSDYRNPAFITINLL